MRASHSRTISMATMRKSMQDLAVDAGLAQVAADPAVEAEVDEGSEGPDFFAFDESAEDAGGEAEARR